jgi:hypothetical protein
MRVSKHSEKEFTAIYSSDLTDEEKTEKLSISKAYMELKAKKYGLKKKKVEKPKTDYPVIVTETGTYTRSCVTFSTDAVVKAKELREICECNDTDFVPKKYTVTKMSQEEIEKEEFLISKLKRSFGE